MSLKNSFPKTVRLNNNLIIRDVFEQGVYKSLGPIGVKFKRSEVGSSRFSISIKKKVGNAPFRNQIKRYVREAVRIERSKLNCAFEVCFFVTNSPSQKIEYSFVLSKVKIFFSKNNKRFKKGN